MEIYTYCTMSSNYMNFPTSRNNIKCYLAQSNRIFSEIKAHLHIIQLRGMNEEVPNDLKSGDTTRTGFTNQESPEC